MATGEMCPTYYLEIFYAVIMCKIVTKLVEGSPHIVRQSWLGEMCPAHYLEIICKLSYPTQCSNQPLYRDLATKK